MVLPPCARFFSQRQKGHIMFVRTFILALTLAANSSTAAIAQAAKPAAKPATPAVAAVQVPLPEAQLIMIRTALMALSQANSTNNYTVLSGIGSPTFRNSNPPARLAQIFEPFRANKIDLSPLALVVPQSTQPPRIENGRLRMNGLFPTAPMRVIYDLMYEPVAGQWQLFGLAVNLEKADTKK
jgi:hypothetical protein